METGDRRQETGESDLTEALWPEQEIAVKVPR